MDKHQCHNREFPTETVVQDGWEEIRIHGHFNVAGPMAARVPRMITITFKGSRECHQWDKPDGAIHIGVTDPDGCIGCKWIPTNPHAFGFAHAGGGS